MGLPIEPVSNTLLNRLTRTEGPTVSTSPLLSSVPAFSTISDQVAAQESFGPHSVSPLEKSMRAAMIKAGAVADRLSVDRSKYSEVSPVFAVMTEVIHNIHLDSTFESLHSSPGRSLISALSNLPPTIESVENLDARVELAHHCYLVDHQQFLDRFLIPALEGRRGDGNQRVAIDFLDSLDMSDLRDVFSEGLDLKLVRNSEAFLFSVNQLSSDARRKAGLIAFDRHKLRSGEKITGFDKSASANFDRAIRAATASESDTDLSRGFRVLESVIKSKDGVDIVAKSLVSQENPFFANASAFVLSHSSAGRFKLANLVENQIRRGAPSYPLAFLGKYAKMDRSGDQRRMLRDLIDSDLNGRLAEALRKAPCVPDMNRVQNDNIQFLHDGGKPLRARNIIDIFGPRWVVRNLSSDATNKVRNTFDLITSCSEDYQVELLTGILCGDLNQDHIDAVMSLSSTDHTEISLRKKLESLRSNLTMWDEKARKVGRVYADPARNIWHCRTGIPKIEREIEGRQSIRSNRHLTLIGEAVLSLSNEGEDKLTVIVDKAIETRAELVKLARWYRKQLKCEPLSTTAVLTQADAATVEGLRDFRDSLQKRGISLERVLLQAIKSSNMEESLASKIIYSNMLYSLDSKRFISSYLVPVMDGTFDGNDDLTFAMSAILYSPNFKTFLYDVSYDKITDPESFGANLAYAQKDRECSHVLDQIEGRLIELKTEAVRKKLSALRAVRYALDKNRPLANHPQSLTGGINNTELGREFHMYHLVPSRERADQHAKAISGSNASWQDISGFYLGVIFSVESFDPITSDKAIWAIDHLCDEGNYDQEGLIGNLLEVVSDLGDRRVVQYAVKKLAEECGDNGRNALLGLIEDRALEQRQSLVVCSLMDLCASESNSVYFELFNQFLEMDLPEGVSASLGEHSRTENGLCDLIEEYGARNLVEKYAVSGEAVRRNVRSFLETASSVQLSDLMSGAWALEQSPSMLRAYEELTGAGLKLVSLI